MDIAEPIKGWNDLPSPKDTGVGADLIRIKIYRNDLAHLDCCAVNDTYFKDAWKDISGVSSCFVYIKIKMNTSFGSDWHDIRYILNHF